MFLKLSSVLSLPAFLSDSLRLSQSMVGYPTAGVKMDVPSSGNAELSKIPSVKTRVGQNM